MVCVLAKDVEEGGKIGWRLFSLHHYQAKQLKTRLVHAIASTKKALGEHLHGFCLRPDYDL